MESNKLSAIVKDKGKGTQAMRDASEKVIINRLLNKNMPFDNKTALEILKTVSQKSGVSMPFLAGNAFQEGMNFQISNSSGKTKDELINTYGADPEFPIDGYTSYGLDTFGTVAPELIKKGYLPKDFKYDAYNTGNEQGNTVNTANFKTNEDALTAKAAFIKHIQDGVKDYATKKNIKLEPKTMDYLTMSAYNGGMGNARIMMDELSSGKFNQKDFVEQGQTSRQGVHKNIVPRMKKIGIIDKLTSGPVPSFKGAVPTFDDILDMVKNR